MSNVSRHAQSVVFHPERTIPMQLPRILFLCISALASNTFAQLPGPLRDLSWGASEEQVMRTLGSGTLKNSCSDIRAVFARKLGHACDSPYVDNYDVNGIPFKLDLSLSADRRQLVQVSMFYSGNPPSRQAAESAERTWEKRTQSLVAELSAKYGKTERAEEARSEVAVIRILYWKSIDTAVQYTSTVRGIKGGATEEEHSLVYSPAGAKSNSKL